MPKAASPVDSDNESTKGATKSPKRKAALKTFAKDKTDSPEPDETQEDQDGEEDENGDAGSEEEEEYEIEAILEARRGTFPQGRIGYFVKWKGYGPEHNSWVDEQDAGNAQVLIDDYWKKHRKEKRTGPRKSVDAKTPKSAGRGRKSTAAQDENSDVGSSSVAKKRGRVSKTKADSDQEDGKDANDDGEKRASKKSRKNSTKSQPVPSDGEDQVMEDAFIGDMSKYMSVADWEHLIDTVDTVERTGDNDLMVYFRLNNTGERVKENSRLCAQRFPQKLIQFYESNLRWRSSENDVTEES